MGATWGVGTKRQRYENLQNAPLSFESDAVWSILVSRGEKDIRR